MFNDFYLFQTMLLELQCLDNYYVINVDYCKIMKNILKRSTKLFIKSLFLSERIL